MSLSLQPVPARHRWIAGAACGALLGLVGGCGSSEEEGAASSAGVKTTKITLSNPPNVSNAALHIALDRGYFREEGLEVKADIDLGAGSTVEAVVGGQVDMAWTNVVGALVPYSQGAPIRLVAITDHAVPGYLEVLASKGSDIRQVSDLEGKKLAVLSPSTTCILAVQSALVAEGLDPDTVSFEPVAPQDHATVLESGKVAATCDSDPFRTQIIDKLGARRVYDTSKSELGEFVIGGYVVSAKFAAENPKATAAFQRALSRATQDAKDDPELVRRTLPTYTQIKAEAAQRIVITDFASPATDPGGVQRLAEAMLKYKMVDEPIDTKGLLATGGQG